MEPDGTGIAAGEIRILATLILLSSAAALVVEIGAARLMAPLVGMSLFTWTAIISVVLAGFALGHWIGGILASRAGDLHQAGRWLAIALALAGLTTAMSVAGLRFGEPIIAVAGGVRIPTVLLLTGFLFLAPSLAAGVVSPLVTAIAVDRGARWERARILAMMFAASAGGAIIGVLAAGYLLVPILGAAGALVMAAAVQGALGAIAWVRVSGGWAGLTVGAVVLAVAITGSLAASRPICDSESQYYCLKAMDTTALTGYPSRGLKIDGWLHSVEALDGGDRLYIESHDFVDALVRRERGGLTGVAALFIGGGGLTVPELWRRSGDSEDLVVLEIDPAVTGFATSRLTVEVEPPLRVIHADGRAGLRDLPANQRFDVIYNDAYTGLTMPAHLVTREFHGEIMNKLREGGVYVVNMIDAPRRPSFLASLLKTLRMEFAVVEIWRRDGAGRGTRRMHYGIVARHQAAPVSTISSARGSKRSWSRLDGPEIARLFDGVTGMVLTDDLAPVDRLLANFCSFSFLRALSVDVTRAEAC